MQPEDGAVRVVSEPIVACVCVVVEFQEQIQSLWKVHILVHCKGPERGDTGI